MIYTYLSFLLADINIHDNKKLLENSIAKNASYLAMISFDEGPTKNIKKLISIASSYNIPLVFHLDPFHENFSKEIIDYIHENNMEVGIAITEEIEDDENQIKKVFLKYKEAFINKSTYVPILLRLPASRFRDRYMKSVDLLPNILNLLQQRNYKIIPAYEFYNLNTNLLKTDIITYKTNYKKKGEELIIKTIKEDGTIVKKINLPYNNLNKLKARELTKLNLQDYEKIEEVYDDMFNNEESDDSSERESSEEVKYIAQENCSNNIISYCFLLFLIIK
ncbi:hypothetical protein NAPIS_ORF00426 [Vairimorpha apis BRL 01]|uniref:Polysaccharide deacetylase n=1 Tax=Vairimorpha apis BRL 01 TaxID=1037528 RepID=T0LCH9_9MICR|nr:hypothetical protein NAPIS_ORF00426 [Vairimorpha apis BRL 01]